MKRLLKWIAALLLLAVVLVVIFFLSLDSILRVVIQRNIRAQTGLAAQIGKFHLGLLEPVVDIKDLRELWFSGDAVRAGTWPARRVTGEGAT